MRIALPHHPQTNVAVPVLALALDSDKLAVATTAYLAAWELTSGQIVGSPQAMPRASKLHSGSLDCSSHCEW